MILKKYFPELTEKKLAQLSQLADLYKEWNDKINVISRKDIDNVIEHHILHSLAIAKAIQFKPGTDVLDLGTGGGLPGIPLAIYFEDSLFGNNKNDPRLKGNSLISEENSTTVYKGSFTTCKDSLNVFLIFLKDVVQK
jgi:hypothetical protein